MPRRRPPVNRPSPVNQHYPQPRNRVVEEGELLVTSDGCAIIDVPLRRSRALLVRSEEAVVVYFKPDEDPCPPCAGSAPDCLEWETVERHHELFLKISWHVNCARTIIFKIFEVD